MCCNRSLSLFLPLALFPFSLSQSSLSPTGAVGRERETEENCLFEGEIAIKSTTIGGAPDQLAKYPAVWEQMSSFELVLDLAKKFFFFFFFYDFDFGFDFDFNFNFFFCRTLDFTVDGKLIDTISYAHKSLSFSF